MSDDARPASGSPAPAEHEQLTQLGKYIIQRKLGSGGMGTVFLAQDSDLKRIVALKVLAKDRAENPVLVRRFKAEGQAAAYLQHKNIVGVYDSGQIDGFLYIALEFVDGQDVLELIRKRGVIPVKRSVEIIKQVAEALQHAYEKQIVHRDIKPSNLLIKNDGTVKLADLGLARSIDETLDTSITRVGTTVGTVDYMSPEQARNSKGTDIRSDLYSLGCTWYHMLTGVPPFGEGSVTNKLQAHAVAPIPDPRSRNERIPEGVVAVLHRMMAKSPKDRYETPAELLEDLNNPGLTRSGLNADVLAALAQPGGAAELESASSEIFEQRSPFESEVEDDEDESPRRPPTKTTFEFDDETSDASVARHAPGPKSKPSSDQNSPRAKAPPREEPAETDEERPPGPARPIKSKSKGADPGTSGPLPRRQTKAERGDEPADDSGGAKKRFKQRKLPPRSSDTVAAKAPLQMSLDPDRIRTIVIGGIVVVLLAGIAYAFSQMGGRDVQPTGTQGNVAAALEQSRQEAGPPPAESSNQQPSPPPTDQPPGKPSAEAADASTPLRQTAEPIAGVEEFKDLNSNAAREIVPNWLFQVRKAPPAPAVTTIVVRRPGTSGDGLATLAEAVARLPAGEAVIEFDGDGPFAIAPLELPARPHITLRAKAGSRPVLVFTSAGLKDGEGCLRAAGPLSLRGLHLILATSPETVPKTSLLQGPSIGLRDCTVQSVGPAVAGVALLKVDGVVGRETTGCVLENCHLHSASASGIRMTGPAARVFSGNSLFCFADAPAMVIDPVVKAGAVENRRSITLIRSTIIGGKTAFRLEHNQKEAPEAVEFLTRKSSFDAAAATATFLDLVNWPASGEALSEKPTASGVSWKSEQTTLSGWNLLARMSQSGAASEAAGFEGDHGWQRFWRQVPSGTRLLTAIRAVPPNFTDVDASVLTPEVPAASTAEMGAKVALLPVPPAALVDRVRTLAKRRRLPADFIADRSPSATVEFDLAKPGLLNSFLNDPSKCPDGALVRLRGAGIKLIPALQLTNRVLHLEFVQTEGVLLTIRPQSGLTAEALMTIQGGDVSIANARIVLPESDRQVFPSTVLVATGANVALLNCTITGPAEQSSRLGPLVRFGGADPQNSLLIRDSLLIGGRVSVEVDLTGRMLDIENSILAATADALSVTVTDASRPGDLAVASSTLAAGRSVLQVAPLPDGSKPALTVVASDSVVLPSGPSGNAVTMLGLATAKDDTRIAWWEDGLGFAMRTTPAVSVGTGVADGSSWSDRWGPGHVLRLFNSELAVLFEKPFENLAKADVESFRLNSRCGAAQGSTTGGPLGATAPQLGASTEGAQSKPGETPVKPPPTTAPKRPRSVF